MTQGCQEAKIVDTMSPNVNLILAVVQIVWLLVLTAFFWRIYSHYNRLIKISSGKSLQTVIDNLLQELALAKSNITYLQKKCDTIDQEGKLHIQRIGLVRFNPFKDTGGDQSFIVALLDGNNTGVVISGLYSRAGTRWYTKKLIAGKPIEHNLSEEEQQAIKEANILTK